jgi:hypothetical protein
VTPQPPENPERFRQRHDSGWLVLLRPPQRRPQVGVLGVQPVEPGQLLGGAQVRHRPLGQVEEVRGVGGPHRPFLPALDQQLAGVLPNRFQHPEPGLRVPSGCGPVEWPDQALVDQRGDAVEGREPTGRLHPLDGKAAAEDR